MKFSSQPETLLIWLKQTQEMLRVFSSGTSFPDPEFEDMEQALNYNRAEGSCLAQEDLVKLRNLLVLYQKIYTYFHEHANLYPALNELFHQTLPNPTYIYEINKILDESGEVKDHASVALYDINQKIRAEESKVRKRILQVSKNVVDNEWGPQNSITIRNGRLVISVYNSFKRNIQGVIHGESATGQTAFIEPADIFEQNNIIHELYIEKATEIRKILISLTTKLRPGFSLFSKMNRMAGIYDFMVAKAKTGYLYNGNIPQISEGTDIHYINAFHPLLFMHFKKNKQKPIPFDLKLDRDKRILVVSGPNAGGKSVLLKSVALIQLMIQHGLPVPVSPDSNVGIYKKIFIDIGDQQNIDQDLSTYSSHLTNMKYMLKWTDSRTLICIDEMGTGTDPAFGGNMAVAVLKYLNRKFCKGIITTHYSQIKKYATEAHGMFNGSMQFDPAQLIPLYKFQEDYPGSSYTFEIAQRVGISADIIQEARSRTGKTVNKSDELIIELEKKKKEITELKLELEKKLITTQQKEIELSEKIINFEKKKKETETKYKKEAQNIIHQANRLIEKTIREIKEQKAENTREIRKELHEFTQQINIESGNPVPNPITNNASEFNLGDTVHIISTDKSGEVLGIGNNKIEIRLGNVKKWVDISDLEKVIQPLEKKQPITRKIAYDTTEKMMHFNAELNVIGLHASEAIQEVLKFIDDALILSYERVRIIHGRGTGALRTKIRKELKQINNVARFYNESAELGGDAITIVELN